MSKITGVVIFTCVSFFLSAQSLVFQNTLPFTQYNYKNKSNKVESYNFLKPEKKAFLFYDIISEPMAEVMYNGCGFVFNNTAITIFPIYFTGQLIKKASENFPSKIPTQLFESPNKSDFRVFNITTTDFPILVVYNEKNELCGFAKSVEQITDIDCGGQIVPSKFLRLQILTENKDKTTNPYAFKPIVLLGGDKNDTILKTMTDKYGDFDALLPHLNQDYIITVNEKNPTINFVVLSTQSGRKIGNFKSTDKGFEYRILKIDLIKLPDIYVEEDISLKLKPLDKKDLKDFVVTENLFYELGESKLSQSSKDLLNKMMAVLQNYAQFNILVTSHTDAHGDETTNLKLSIKRSEEVVNYLLSKDIAKERLKAEGKGETQIRNRCFNNIDCSDKEHEYNRRTEFKFTRK